MVTYRTGFRQVHAAQHLGAHHLHLSISLDQQAGIGGKCCQGLLTQQFGVGSLTGGPFSDEGIAALHQACPTRCAEAFFQRLQFIDHGIKQLIAVVQQQAQTLPLRA